MLGNDQQQGSNPPAPAKQTPAASPQPAYAQPLGATTYGYGNWYYPDGTVAPPGSAGKDTAGGGLGPTSPSLAARAAYQAQTSGVVTGINPTGAQLSLSGQVLPGTAQPSTKAPNASPMTASDAWNAKAAQYGAQGLYSQQAMAQNIANNTMNGGGISANSANNAWANYPTQMWNNTAGLPSSVTGLINLQSGPGAVEPDTGTGQQYGPPAPNFTPYGGGQTTQYYGPGYSDQGQLSSTVMPSPASLVIDPSSQGTYGNPNPPFTYHSEWPGGYAGGQTSTGDPFNIGSGLSSNSQQGYNPIPASQSMQTPEDVYNQQHSANGIGDTFALRGGDGQMHIYDLTGQEVGAPTASNASTMQGFGQSVKDFNAGTGNDPYKYYGAAQSPWTDIGWSPEQRQAYINSYYGFQ